MVVDVPLLDYGFRVAGQFVSEIGELVFACQIIAGQVESERLGST